MARRAAPKPTHRQDVHDDPVGEPEDIHVPGPDAGVPVDEAVATLLAEAGEDCPHTLKRSRYRAGRWTRYCEACGMTWPLEV